MSDMSIDSLGNLFDSGLMKIGPQGRILNYSIQMLEILEMSKSELEGCKDYNTLIETLAQRGDFGDIAPQDVSAENSALLKTEISTLPDGGSKTLKTTFHVPSGSVLKIRQQVFKDGSLMISACDITEGTIKEKTLEAAFEMGSSGFIHFCLLSNSVKYHSGYFKKILTDAEKSNVARMGLWPLLHPDDVSRVKSVWDAFKTSPKPQKLYIRGKLERQGLVWFKTIFTPQVSNSGTVTGVMAYFIDVTETLSIEGALRMSKKNLEKALQMKTEFISRISHEVRTPMNAMVGIADALIHHHDDPAITPKLQLIQDSSVNILRILDETLDYAKLEANEIKIDPMPANPADVVTRVCQLWQESARKRSITLNYRIDQNVPKSFVFDAHRYEQCLNNLVSNAVKFAKGGKIDVLLTRIQKGGAHPQLVLAVKDNGIGMSPDQEENLFKPFKQADNSISRRFGGTGLGMKITRDIIELMGGKISVKSSAGNGTVFMIALPLDTALPIETEALLSENKPAPDINDADPVISRSLTPRHAVETPKGILDLTAQIMGSVKPAPAPPVKIPGPFEHLRVLVVDDNATNHLVVQSLLDGMVGTIHVANDGQEALDVLAVKEVDVVFMDIHMPVMDGIEATLAIRNSDKPWSNVRIVALTADPLYQQKRLCMNIGMDYALAKPVKLADLKEALEATQGKNEAKEATAVFKENTG